MTALSWSRSDRPTLCVTASQDRTVRVWDLTASKTLGVGSLASSRPLHVALSCDNVLVATASEDNIVTIHDVRNLRSPLSHTRMPLETNALLWRPDGRLDVACGRDGFTDAGVIVSVTPRSGAAAIAGGAPEVVKLRAESCGLEVARERCVLAGKARVLRENRAGTMYAVAGMDSTVALFDSATDECIRCLDAGPAGVTNVEFSADGNHVLVKTGRESDLVLLRVADGEVVRRFPPPSLSGANIVAAFHATSDVLVLAVDDTTPPAPTRPPGMALRVVAYHASSMPPPA